MSDYDNDDNDRGFRRIVREAKEEAYHARRQLRREAPEPSMQTKLQVAAALADYHDVLSDYHRENSLRTPWEERDVDWIETVFTETTEIEVPLNRRGRATKSKDVPKAAAVDSRKLYELGKRLDAIAKDLGFAAAAKDTTPGGDANPEDLVNLLQARGQDDAIERLPESFKSESGGEPT